MSEHDSTEPTRRIDPSRAAPTAGLAAPIRELADAAVPPRDRSLPGALCTVAGEIGSGTLGRRARPGAAAADRVLETAAAAIASLEGYVRLRLVLVAPGGDVPTLDGVDPTADRDAAILASDHLHASAYATVGDLPVPDGRRLECYRLLIEGSAALARQFQGLADDRTGDDATAVAATLAETAGVVGAAAAGATTETRTALRTYSHAVMTALASYAAVADGVDPRTSAARVLAGEGDQGVAATGDGTVDGDVAPIGSTVDRNLERARAAVGRLAERDDHGRPGGATSERIGDRPGSTADGDPTPLERLERATRIPFRHAAIDDE